MRRSRDESGTIAVAVGISSALLLVLCSMVVDLGLARDTRRSSQAASDASALAAGNALYPLGPVPDFPAAVTAARSYAAVNFGVSPGDWFGCVDEERYPITPDPGNLCISFDLALSPTKVRVRMPTKDVGMVFGGLTGVSSVPIVTGAVATIDVSPTQPCGLCVLGQGTHDFQNGDVSVSGADIYVNRSSDVSHNGLVSTDGRILVEGVAGGPSSRYQPSAISPSPRLADPLASLPLPPAGLSSLVARTDPCLQGPGIYTGQNLNNKACVLQPGLYVIRAGTWDGAGNGAGQLVGVGVTLYFTCSSGNAVTACSAGQEGATFDASGNYGVGIAAPTTGPLAGVAIAYDRNNSSMLRMTGNGALSFTGAIYAPSARLQINGNGCAHAYNSMIVVRDVDMNGNNSCLQGRYNVNQNPPPQRGELSLYR